MISFSSRKHKAYLFCLAGMAIDALLGLTKVFVGWQSGSLAAVGDGFNNITDVGAVFLLLLTFYYSAKPSDKEHPFGHGRLEYLNSTVMASVVLYVGVTLCVDSVRKILEPEAVIFSPLLVGGLLLGIVGKLSLSLVYKKALKETGSEAFRAYGADSVSDVLSTVGVLVAVAVEHLTGFLIDGWIGALVSLAIMHTGFTILKQALNSIIGAPPDRELYEEVEKFLLDLPGIYGVHDLIIHDYGPESHFLSAHVEMDSRLSLVESHGLAEAAMEKIKERFGIQAVLHMDPKAVGNPREPLYIRDLEAAIYRTGLPLTYHDFFVEERGEEINLSFEISFKGKCEKSDEEIFRILSEELQKANPCYRAGLMVDRNFISGKRINNA